MNSAAAIDLLKRLIATPSLTRSEQGSAEMLYAEMTSLGFEPQRVENNLIVYNKHFREEFPTVVLCSHHDTVRPNENYTRDPFSPDVEQGRLYGLGSNDAGASLVSLLAAFTHFYDKELPRHNLCLLLTAEEESSGHRGMGIMYEKIINPALVIVGEPTSMDVAIAERGLMVLDCETVGVSGHAAHENTVNPIIESLSDIHWFNDFRFEKESEVLGRVKMSVTVISAGTTHNVVPGKCNFTVDVRNNGCYSNQEVLDVIKANVKCSVSARSTRLTASSIEPTHPFVESCVKHGSKIFGSSTLSDQALVSCQSVKIGVGDTLRSHTADEYVNLSEIEEGVERYIKILTDYLL
ncbi:MAG: M20/M25/M40 family metallo-hydrolase [Rikenellaceae bacterium]